MRKHFYLIALTFVVVSLACLNLNAQESQTYESAIRSGEEMLAGKEYISAKTYFEIALRIRENDTYATEKLNETLQLLQQQMALQEAFFQKMDFGDRLFRENKLEEALKAYNEALELIPTDSYTLGQVEKINKTIREEKERNEAYTQSMTLGENLVNEKRYEEAILQFEQAKSIFPENELPGQKIIETQALLAEQKEKETQYDQLLQEAAQSVARRDFDGAITQYEQALELFPDDVQTRQKLTETVSLRDKSERYEEVLTKADAFYAEKAFRESRSFYQQALEIWPEQTYPVDMLGRISAILNDQEFIDEEAFNEFVAIANEHFAQNEYDTALIVYKKAEELKPDNTFVKDRIDEIQQIFAEKERLENLEENFATAMSDGNAALQSQDYLTAIASYNKAIDLKPEAQEPKDLLAQAENLYSALQEKQQSQEIYETTIAAADQLMLDQEWEDARALFVKAAELPVDVEYATAQIAAIDGILKENAEAEMLQLSFKDRINEADALFDEKKYRPARAIYLAALDILPDEMHPQQRIEEIDELLALQLAEAEALEAEYLQLINEATIHFEANRLNDALVNYNEALGLKPGDAKALDKIAEIEQLLAQQQLAAEAEQQYKTLINEADQLLADDQAEEAKARYQTALNLFSERTYPVEQISIIDELLAERKALLEKQNRYEQLIIDADQDFNQQKWQSAKSRYEEALTINADESWPANQIVLIDEQLAELAKQEEVMAAYMDQVAIADQLFEEDLLSESKIAYTEALNLKPNESYPSAQISLIDTIIAERKAAEEKASRIADLISQGEGFMEQEQFDQAESVYNEILLLEPGQQAALAKLSEITVIREEIMRENQEKYQEFIAIGDQYLDEKDYREAVTAYKTARSYMPGNAYANQKIEEAETLLKEYLLAVTTEYNKLINEADRHFNAKTYDRAIESYSNAERVNPYETYPREMIRKIAQIIEDNKLVEVNISPVMVNANTTQRFEFSPVNVSERRTNYVLIKARNSTDTEFPLIFSYGSTSGRNGGFVLPIPANSEYQDYVIRIGSQYRWFSEDNNWFTFSPENGDIEIGLVQISKGN